MLYVVGRLEGAGKIGVIICWVCLVCLLFGMKTGSVEVVGCLVCLFGGEASSEVEVVGDDTIIIELPLSSSFSLSSKTGN